ncbi:paraneoplastic antigen Ma3-like [Alosa pseudoharengus]|uniref:paraneoplastic antigen Ma3-like n=1 Tax=Alosa pseudoharengus TaxID=34774 RepID=UPI003F888F27
MPAEAQRVIVEHIVKRDSLTRVPTARELRPFSGNYPKPPNEVDYQLWRLRVTQLLNDASITEGQQRRIVLDSLLPPALTVALRIGHNEVPSVYVRELDNAYGDVSKGDELYIQFIETHQNSEEKPSDYLRRLQSLLHEVTERNGVAKQDADCQLLKQFLRGCWDDQLIAALRLREYSDESAYGPPPFSDLLFKIRTYEGETQQKELRRKRHLGNSVVRVHTKTQLASEPVPAEGHSFGVFNVPMQEQLEAKIRQLEVELQKVSSTGNKPSKRDNPRQSSGFVGQRAVVNSPSASAAKQTKLKRFCYNCGEESHLLSACSNPTNAILVQTRLCERYHANQGLQQLTSQSGEALNL